MKELNVAYSNVWILLEQLVKKARKHPQGDSKCHCEGRGWALFTTNGSQYVPDGTVTVQKCDECYVYSYDESAAEEATQAGIPCQLEYPCVVTVVVS